MKRSIDEITPSPSDGVLSSSVKRLVADVDPADDADMSSKSFLLASQNKSLNKELMRNKRSIAEARKELELMRRKSREMESLVSLIQRAWSQLDIDTSMLLDSLGDSEVQVSDEGSSELLHRLVNTGVKYMKFDPTHMEGIPTLNADQWSTMEDVEKERVRLHSAVGQQKEGRSNSESDHNEHEQEHDRQRPEEDNLDEKYGGPVEENLSGHVSFTMSLLERLCNAINDASGNTALQVDAVSAMNSMRELRAERLILSDRITKLTAEIIDLSAKVRIAETERIRAEANLDRAVAAAKEAQQQASTKAPEGTTAEGTVVDGQVVPTSPQPASNPTVERELRRQVTLLERQLAESESAKAQVEMTLTERLARPLPQTEVQVADMRNAMEELRQQCKHRVSALIAEGDQLQEKVRNLELALLHLEAISAARVDEVVTLTQKEIAATKADKDAVQATLASLQADVTMIEQLKTQLAEYQGLGELCNSEVAKLQTRVKQLTETQAVLQGNLEQSRGREEALEQALATKAATDALLQSVAVEVVETKAHSRSGSMEEGEERMEVEAPTPAPAPKVILPADYQLLVDQSRARVDDLQKELQNSSSNINDLIMEIETVAAEELKARAQGTRLLQQITECQSMQRVALEENLRLQNQIEDLRASNRDAEAKMELMKSIMVQQESIINQLKSAEHGVRTEFQTIKKSAMQAQGTRHIDEQRLLEARQQLADTEHGVKGALKRNQELQSRCDELSRQCEAERKAKMDTQRELTKLKGAKKDKGASASASSSGTSGSGGGGGAEETDMLEITLGMLRCSVCKDRFKSCAITRCFHLFCKECIDENLRNRSRKCPACGEKFGQDDVTPVYFN